MLLTKELPVVDDVCPCDELLMRTDFVVPEEEVSEGAPVEEA